jgi:hypothetical protein
VKEGKGRLMGFGHRVYKNYDPRATIIKQAAYDVFEVTGKNPLLDIALKLEEVALQDDYFVSRKLYPNVDFYSGLIYQAMGFPVDMFTVLFAIPRTAGWLAHWCELLGDKDQKISRPRQWYTGPAERDYVDELSELADGLAIVESFSHCVVLAAGERVGGVRRFRGRHRRRRGRCRASLVARPGGSPGLHPWPRRPRRRQWRLRRRIRSTDRHRARERRPPSRPLRGHRRMERGDQRPAVRRDPLGPPAVARGGRERCCGGCPGVDPARWRRFLPRDVLRPDVEFATEHTLRLGDDAIELHHARGETDDHLWAWLPQRRTVIAGDFLIWNFPNAGNPQKVQRYPVEWAAALRAMAACQPELLVPAHGLPIPVGSASPPCSPPLPTPSISSWPMWWR